MTILKNLAVVTGTWVNREGETKKTYRTIGHLHEGQHGNYITLDSDVNLAAYPRKEGDSRVMVNLYDPKPRDGARQADPPAQSAASFDDDYIPF
jgi:hypothetical protein